MGFDIATFLHLNDDREMDSRMSFINFEVYRPLFSLTFPYCKAVYTGKRRVGVLGNHVIRVWDLHTIISARITL